MKYVIIPILTLMLTPIIALAAFPSGQWVVEYYPDNAKTTAKGPDKICIVADGTWHTTTGSTSPDALGFWAIKGNNLHFQGNERFSVLGSSSGEIVLTNSTLMTGYWQAWHEGSLGGMWRTKWSFNKVVCDPA